MTSEDQMTKLYAWASRMGAVIVCVREPNRRFHDWIAQTHTPGTVTLHRDDYHYPLSAEEKAFCKAHIDGGGSVVLLSPKAANDARTIAHELGHCGCVSCGLR